MRFLLILRPADAARASVLAGSIRRHHPDSTIYALPVGFPAADLPPGAHPLDAQQMMGTHERWARAALAFGPDDLVRILRPAALLHLIAEDTEPVVALSPDTLVLGSLDVMRQHAAEVGLALSPRMSSVPEDDGRTPYANEALLAGIIDTGVMAVGPGGAEALRHLLRTREGAGFHMAEREIDGRFEDLLAVNEPRALITDVPVALAWWNLHQVVVRGTAGRPTVDDQPVRAFRFSGFRHERPWLLSHDQSPWPRVLLSEHPVVADIAQAYALALEEAGALAESAEPSGDLVLAGGLVVDRNVRRAVRNGIGTALRLGQPAPPNPLLGDDEASLIEWLNEPMVNAQDGRVSNYVYAIWSRRHDLRRDFPDPLNRDASGLVEWVRDFGPYYEQAPDGLLPAHTRRRPLIPPGDRDGVNLAGYLVAGSGVGQATRQFAEALEAADIPHAALSVQGGTRSSVGEEPDVREAPFNVNVVCVNLDWLARFRDDVGTDFFRDRYSIGVWWWESNILPHEYHAGFDVLDELWVGSEYVANCLAPHSPVPVRVFPLPVTIPGDRPTRSREALGLPEGYLFMFSFDFHSTAERKNPEGVIEAFSRAFAPGEGPVLVIKSIHGDEHPGDLERVRLMAAHRPDIHVVDGFLPAEVRDDWTRAMDCCVSLHRCEGFGLVMAEAMALGKPVIATDWSANTEFMTHENSYLVPWTPMTLREQAGPYPAGTAWAEPDLEEAARMMRHVVENAAEARAKGALAREHIATTRRVESMATWVRENLSDIDNSVPRPRPDADPDLDMSPTLSTLAAYQRQRRGAVVRGWRRHVLRALRPYTAFEDEFDDMVLDAAMQAHARSVRLERRIRTLERGLRDSHTGTETEE